MENLLRQQSDRAIPDHVPVRAHPRVRLLDNFEGDAAAAPQLALSLFSFNAGIELGQIMFVAAVFQITLYLASSAWQNTIRFAVSFGVVCLSMYWFAQRVFP